LAEARAPRYLGNVRIGALAIFGILAAASTAVIAGASPARAAGHAACGRTRFVTIYDSHGLTPFGDRLDAALLAHDDAQLTSFTLGGASPGWIVRRPISPRGYAFDSCDGKPILPRNRLPKQDLRMPSLDDLLRVPEGTYDRQVVILTLGSNVPGEPRTHTPAVEQAVRTIASHPGAVCIWVGPPAIRKWSAGYSDQVYAAIRDGIRAAGGGAGTPACHLIDSRAFTTYPAGGDGIHLPFSEAGVAAATRWAEGVGRAIDAILDTSLARPAAAAGLEPSVSLRDAPGGSSSRSGTPPPIPRERDVE
jgi:hypothetical protein